jgi:hypothetical protein
MEKITTTKEESMNAKERAKRLKSVVIPENDHSVEDLCVAVRAFLNSIDYMKSAPMWTLDAITKREALRQALRNVEG